MFCGNDGALLGVFDHINFVGEDLPVSAQGYCVHLGTWVDLDSHGLYPVLCGEHQADVEGYLSV